MKTPFRYQIFLLIAILIIGFLLWGKWVIDSHPNQAIVSWDEGFHGGAAFYFSQSLIHNFDFNSYEYIKKDFLNGIIWYLPLWSKTAGLLGAVFSPSVEIYRLTTLIFAIFSLLVVGIFAYLFGDFLSAIIATLTLAFVPIFIVYSHLMMLEVPLLFSVSLTLLSFYYYLSKEKLTTLNILLTFLAFTIGVTTKIISLGLIFETISLFGLYLYYFQKQTRLYKRFFSRFTIYFLAASLLVFSLYRYYNIKYSNADILNYYFSQQQTITGGEHSFIVSFFLNLFGGLAFYSQDFLRMPLLSLFWIVPFFLLPIFYCGTLSIYLLIWGVLTYLSFSGVRPLAYQYILSIFVPISLSAGLFWSKVLKAKWPSLKYLLGCLIAALMVWSGVINLNKSAVIIWRNTLTNQDQAVKFVVDNAQFGDRIYSSGDGTRFLVRLLGDNKKLQTINGAAPVCSDFINDSSEWAISDYGPQNPFKLKNINSSNWRLVKTYPLVNGEINVYKNEKVKNNISLSFSESSKKICPRVFPLGKTRFVIVATPHFLYQNCPVNTSLDINLKTNPVVIIKKLSINQDQLKSQDNKEQTYVIDLDQKTINQYLYLDFNLPSTIKFDISKISFEKIE